MDEIEVRNPISSLALNSPAPIALLYKERAIGEGRATTMPWKPSFLPQI